MRKQTKDAFTIFSPSGDLANKFSKHRLHTHTHTHKHCGL